MRSSSWVLQAIVVAGVKRTQARNCYVLVFSSNWGKFKSPW